MLQDLSDPDSIGPNMAKALLTTFYGAVLANVIFTPISKKLQSITDSEIILKEAIVEGLLSIQASEAPSTTQAKLETYLSPKLKALFRETLENKNG